MTSRLESYLQKSASAAARTSVKTVGEKKILKGVKPNLLTLALAVPAGYGMYRALDDLLKKHRES